MQNGTFPTQDEGSTGRALVPLPLPTPRPPGELPASFIAQLIDTRAHAGRTSPSHQALRHYGAADALATARTRRFERVV